MCIQQVASNTIKVLSAPDTPHFTFDAVVDMSVQQEGVFAGMSPPSPATAANIDYSANLLTAAQCRIRLLQIVGTHMQYQSMCTTRVYLDATLLYCSHVSHTVCYQTASSACHAMHCNQLHKHGMQLSASQLWTTA